MMKLSTILILLFSFTAHAKFIGGIGYLEPGHYRVDNEINPLPFGMSVVPLIIYRGERLSVFGPVVNYALIKGPISLGLSVNASGDRYKARDLEKRETAINAGGSVRIFGLTLAYGKDISDTYKGDTFNASFGWRFKLSDKLTFIPSYGREYLSERFVNYYYGIAEDEIGEFEYYSAQNAVNDLYRANLTLQINEKHSLTLNYTYRKFDKVIYESPTINKDGFGRTNLFWGYIF